MGERRFGGPRGTGLVWRLRKLPRLHAKDHGIDVADRSGIIRCVRRIDHEVSLDAVYAEAVLPESGKVRTTRN